MDGQGNDRVLADRVADGIVGATRIRFGAVAVAELVETDGLLVAISNLPAPELNSAYVVREPTHPASALGAAEAELSTRGMAFGIDLEAGRHPSVDVAVRAAGLKMIVVRPAMAALLRELEPVQVPDGVTIRPIETSEDASALARVDAEAFEGDLDISERFYAAGVVDVEGTRGFVAWDGDVPVATGVAYEVAGSVGIYGVSVVPAARRRGIGSAVTVACARAFAGADIAWLQASEMGLGVYERLGFRRVSEWEVWVRPPAGTPVCASAYTRVGDRARRGASGALYPQSASAGLNPRPRLDGSEAAPGTERRWSGPTRHQPANPVRSGRKQR